MDREIEKERDMDKETGKRTRHGQGDWKKERDMDREIGKRTRWETGRRGERSKHKQRHKC